MVLLSLTALLTTSSTGHPGLHRQVACTSGNRTHGS
jgi:hypothetical protein